MCLPPVEKEEGILVKKEDGKGRVLRRRMGIPDELLRCQADRAAIAFYNKAQQFCGQDLSQNFSWYVARGLAQPMIDSMYSNPRSCVRLTTRIAQCINSYVCRQPEVPRHPVG